MLVLQYPAGWQGSLRIQAACMLDESVGGVMVHNIAPMSMYLSEEHAQGVSSHLWCTLMVESYHRGFAVQI